MESTEIAGYDELLMYVRQIEVEKMARFDDLSQKFEAVMYTLNPVSFVKESLHTLANDREVHIDIAKVGLNMGANLLIDQVLGKYRSVKGFFSSVFFENISAYFINQNASKIVSGIGKRIFGISVNHQSVNEHQTKDL